MTSTPTIYPAPTHTPPLYYRLMLRLVKPLYRFKVWQRSRQNETYQREVNERFGHNYPERPDCDAVIWCHAVSLGETNTIAPMLDELLKRGYGIWLTNTTQTGYDRAETRFESAIRQGTLVHTFVPVDTPPVVKRFLDNVKPSAALFVETELWPVMLSVLNQRNIPTILVNGRLSQRSYEKYQRFVSLSHNMMKNISLVIAQDGDSAKRFRGLHLNIKKIRVAESLKWSIQSTNLQLSHETGNNNSDASITKALKPEVSANLEQPDIGLIDKETLNISRRPIWVAASTHEGEESIIIAVHQQLIKNAKLTNALLILVPRHPERFAAVATVLEESGLNVARRSQDKRITDKTQVYLADTMGELMSWYSLSDVAFVGGSLVDIGGHNPIEPASVGTPIVIGAYTQTCQLLVDALAEEGALIQITQAEKDIDNVGNNVAAQLLDALTHWLSKIELAKQAGQRGQYLVAQRQNATFKQLEMIEPLLPVLSPQSSSQALPSQAPSIDSNAVNTV